MLLFLLSLDFFDSNINHGTLKIYKLKNQSPPVVASILGIIVGSNRILNRLVIGSNAPFHPLFEAMRTLGTGFIINIPILFDYNLI